MPQYEPLVVAVALSLYTYNVSPGARFLKLKEVFDYLEFHHIDHALSHCQGAFAATELSYDLAKVYIDQALEKYGEEAKERVAINKVAYEA